MAIYYDIHEAELSNGVSFLVIVKQKGDEMKIQVDDGDGQLFYTPYVLMNQTNPNQMCKEIYQSLPSAINPRVCDWVTNGKYELYLFIKLTKSFFGPQAYILIRNNQQHPIFIYMNRIQCEWESSSSARKILSH